jgi:hypothetical protein
MRCRMKTIETDEVQLVRETIRDLEEGIESLQEEQEMTGWRIEQKQNRLSAWKGKLRELTGEPATEPQKRSPRGANLRLILDLLRGPQIPRAGLSTGEIVSKTQLSFSSVQASLKQGVQTGVITQGVEGFWQAVMEKPVNLATETEQHMNGKVS